MYSLTIVDNVEKKMEIVLRRLQLVEDPLASTFYTHSFSAHYTCRLTYKWRTAWKAPLQLVHTIQRI